MKCSARPLFYFPGTTLAATAIEKRAEEPLYLPLTAGPPAPWFLLVKRTNQNIRPHSTRIFKSDKSGYLARSTLQSFCRIQLNSVLVGFLDFGISRFRHF